MRKILAISGGVDSMVLLHAFRNDPSVLVLHVNHGTRESCFDDEKFVLRVASEYGREFVCRRLLLGANVSEERARYARHDIFSRISVEHGGSIYTAHHGDDLIESVAINILRGTGWRGLTPFGNSEVLHPFLDTSLLPADLQRWFRREGDDFPISRAEIYEYASRFKISFRQDPTNVSERYLRNRLRGRVFAMSRDEKRELWKLYHETNNLRRLIEAGAAEILSRERAEVGWEGTFSGRNSVASSQSGAEVERRWFFEMDDAVAVEILRTRLKQVGVSATRPQILDFLSAIREYGPGKKFNLPGGRMVKFTKSSFVI